MLAITTQDHDKVAQELLALEKNLQGKALKSGLRQIAKPTATALRSSLPIVTGVTKKSIGYRNLSNSRKREMGVTASGAGIEVGATKKVIDESGTKRSQAYVLRFLNHGTRPHIIKPKKNSSSKALKFGGFFAKQIKHPGMSGKPYLLNAWRSQYSESQSLFTQGALLVLEKHRVQPV